MFVTINSQTFYVQDTNDILELYYLIIVCAYLREN